MTAITLLVAVALLVFGLLAQWLVRRYRYRRWLNAVAESFGVSRMRHESDAELRERLLCKLTAPSAGLTLEDVRLLFCDTSGLLPGETDARTGGPGEVVLSVRSRASARRIATGLRAVEEQLPCTVAVRCERGPRP